MIRLFYTFLFQVIIPGSWIFPLLLTVPLFLALNVKDNACVTRNEGWQFKTGCLLGSTIVVGAMVLMAGLYCRIIYTLWVKRDTENQLTFQQRVSIDKLLYADWKGTCKSLQARWSLNCTATAFSDKITSPEVILDKHVTFDDQIDHVCKSSINHLRNLFRIRRYLDVNAASTDIHAFIITRLDYCNHLYFGLLKYKVKKLQQIQNILLAMSLVQGNMTILLLC